MAVTDLIYRGNGMTVTFDDGKVAEAVLVLRDGSLVYEGLTSDQITDLVAIINDSSLRVDPRSALGTWKYPRTRVSLIDTTLNVDTDEFLSLPTVTGPRILTIPKASDVLSADGFARRFTIATANNDPLVSFDTLTVQLSDGDTFPQGHNKIVLMRPGSIQLQGVNTGAVATWGSQTKQEIALQVTDVGPLTADVDYGTSLTPMFFTDINHSDNDSVIDVVDDTTSTVIQCKVTGKYKISYSFDIPGSGGGWTLNADIFLNDSTVLPFSASSTSGTGASRPGHLSLVHVIEDLLDGDELRFRVSHADHSGTIENLRFTIEVEV